MTWVWLPVHTSKLSITSVPEDLVQKAPALCDAQTRAHKKLKIKTLQFNNKSSLLHLYKLSKKWNPSELNVLSKELLSVRLSVCFHFKLLNVHALDIGQGTS